MSFDWPNIFTYIRSLYPEVVACLLNIHATELSRICGVMRSLFRKFPTALLCGLAGVAPARVFHCVYKPRARDHFLSIAVSMCNAEHLFVSPTSLLLPLVSLPMSSTTTPLYCRACSRVDVRKYGRITSKIRDLRIGEGRRSSPRPSGLAIDEAQTERVDVVNF